MKNSARYYHKCIQAGLHGKYRLLLADFNDTLNFLDRYLINQASNVTKIRPVGAQFFHTDRRTESRLVRRGDTTKPVVAFQNFAVAHKYMHVSLCLVIRHDEDLGGLETHLHSFSNIRSKYERHVPAMLAKVLPLA